VLNFIRKLKKEGIYQQNHELAKPLEFCKVAVIAPPQAAGLGDFQSQADILSSLGLCEFDYYSASFQGQNRVTEISKAFEMLNQKHLKQAYDAIVMIRGGGAKADLFQLNEYEIAKAICTAPLPVIIGIGHERDKTLLDEVANHACHTPSLAIAYITSTIIQNARDARQHWQSFVQRPRKLLNSAQADNARLLAFIREQSIKRLGVQREELNFQMQTVKNASQNQLAKATHQIKSLMEQVLLGDPKRVLNRGYAIIRNSENKVISTQIAAQQEASLIIEFKDGRINCGKK